MARLCHAVLMLMMKVRIDVELSVLLAQSLRLFRLLVIDAPEARRVCSKRYPLRTGGKKRDAFTSKSTHFPDKCHNLNELPPLWMHSPMSPWCPDSRRSYLTGQIQGPSLWQWLQVHGGSWRGWRLEVLMGLLHRASSRCITLLPPKEGEYDHVLVSLTPPPRREPKPETNR